VACLETAQNCIANFQRQTLFGPSSILLQQQVMAFCVDPTSSVSTYSWVW